MLVEGLREELPHSRLGFGRSNICLKDLEALSLWFHRPKKFEVLFYPKGTEYEVEEMTRTHIGLRLRHPMPSG
jgi:hypothetical protein